MASSDTGRLILWQRLAVSSYILLMIDVLVWEAWGAPAQQASVIFGIGMKLGPLLVGLLPVLRSNSHALMWMSILMLLYLTEGSVLAYSEFSRGWGPHNELVYAVAEMVFSTVFIFSAGTYIRIKHPRIKSNS